MIWKYTLCSCHCPTITIFNEFVPDLANCLPNLLFHVLTASSRKKYPDNVLMSEVNQNKLAWVTLMPASPMGHFCPTFTLTARPSLTIIAVVMRRVIAWQTKAIAPLIPSVVVVIFMSSVVVLAMLPFFSLSPIFTVFLFSFFLLSLPLLLLLSFFYPSPTCPSVRIPRISRGRLNGWHGWFLPWLSLQRSRVFRF